MPKAVHDLAKKLQRQGKSEDSSWAIATAALKEVGTSNDKQDKVWLPTTGALDIVDVLSLGYVPATKYPSATQVHVQGDPYHNTSPPYTYPEVSEQAHGKCGQCRYYVEGGSCALVKGAIDPINGTCKFWEGGTPLEIGTAVFPVYEQPEANYWEEPYEPHLSETKESPFKDFESEPNEPPYIKKGTPPPLDPNMCCVHNTQEGGQGSGRKALGKVADFVSKQAPHVVGHGLQTASSLGLFTELDVKEAFDEGKHPRHGTGSEKGGQFAKGDGTQGAPKEKGLEIPETKNVFDTQSYDSANGQIFIEVDKVLPEYEKHIGHIRDIWNKIPAEQKRGIKKFHIGDAPYLSLNAIGSFNTETNTLGIHLSNAALKPESTDEEIQNYMSSVLLHEVAHSQYNKFSNDQTYEWEKQIMDIPPITKYLGTFKDKLEEAAHEFNVQDKRRDMQFNIIDQNTKKLRSDVSDVEKAELQSDNNFRNSVIDGFADAYESAKRYRDRMTETYANETHSEFAVLSQGQQTLWESNMDSFEKIKPIYNQVFGGT